MLLARRLVNGRERGCLQVVSCSVLRLVNMSTRAMRLKTQARALACLQVVYLTLSVVKEQSLSASLVRLEKELFPLYLATCFASGLRPVDMSRASRTTTPSSKSSPRCKPGWVARTCATTNPKRMARHLLPRLRFWYNFHHETRPYEDEGLADRRSCRRES